MSKTIKILIADDHPIVRKGLRILISTEPDMEVVGEAINGAEAVALARAIKPDIVLMDLKMPLKDGIQATREIKETDPATHVLVLTSFAEDGDVFPAIKGGASGYLLKDSLPEELLLAIRDVNRGQPCLHPIIADKLVHELFHPSVPVATGEKLTLREMEVLRLIVQGYNNHEIAQVLFVSERTISTHISNLLNKLHLGNRTQAALYAVREGLVSLSPVV
jgi:two-component system, NarL family, response regulator LiaR